MEAAFNAWVTKPANVAVLVRLVENMATPRPRSSPPRPAGP